MGFWRQLPVLLNLFPYDTRFINSSVTNWKAPNLPSIAKCSVANNRTNETNVCMRTPQGTNKLLFQYSVIKYETLIINLSVVNKDSTLYKSFFLFATDGCYDNQSTIFFAKVTQT